MSIRRARARPGMTLLEVAIVLAIAAVLMGLAIPRARLATDRARVRDAARDVALLLAHARQVAATTTTGAAVGFDSTSTRVGVVARGDTIRLLDLAAVHGVTLRSTRDSLGYDSRGLGRGAANLRLILSRGTAAETVVISRLGRVRGVRW